MGGSTTDGPSLEVPDRRRIVIVPAGGRLGNQIFQWAALRGHLGASERLVLVDCDEFARTFDGHGAWMLRSTRPADRLVLAGLDRLARLPGVGAGEIRQSAKAHLPAWTRDGRIVRSGGFYQAGAGRTIDAARSLRFRTVVADRASALLDRLPEGPRAFVHLRRGDYLVWPSADRPAALPDQWYIDGVRRLRDRIPGVQFVIVSDDPTYAEDVLAPAAGLSRTTVVSREDSSVDLAIMAGCDAGILSASTLSWWGGAFAALRGGVGPFLAPERWLGFRDEVRYPHAIGADFLTFAEVPRPPS